MSNQPREQLAISLRARLLHLARIRRENFDLVLVRYGAERLLYRLSQLESPNFNHLTWSDSI